MERCKDRQGKYIEDNKVYNVVGFEKNVLWRQSGSLIATLRILLEFLYD